MSYDPAVSDDELLTPLTGADVSSQAPRPARPLSAKPEGQALPTSISLRELRADDLHRLLVKARGRIDTVEQVPRVALTWPRVVLDVAVADLIEDGRLAENAHGRLIVRRHPTPVAQ